MIQIYHNNRCSKSRACLAILPTENVEVIDYINNPLSKEELKVLLGKLDMQAKDLIRTNEPIWKEKYKDKNITNALCINAMAKYPKLIERPIVVNGDKALVCRPPELVLEFLS
jgi:arsenate reductase